MMNQPERYTVRDYSIILLFSAFIIILHILTNNLYGFHRDELYYLACANHLDFGYVDHPPLIAWIGAFIQIVVGKSLFAIRLLPALVSGFIVLLTGLTVRRMGGGIFAQTLGCLAVIIAPLFLSMGTMFTTNIFEQLIWAIVVYSIIPILKSDFSRGPILLGLVCGIGILNKFTMIIFAGITLIALLFTSRRKLFSKRYIWFGVLLGIIMVFPNIIWQINHGWPTFEFIREAAINRMEQISPLDFLSQQFFSLNPINFILSLAGLYFYLIHSEGKSYCIFGIMFALLLAFFALQRSKDYYLAPAYPMIWAGGAVFVESLINRFKPKSIKISVVAAMLIAGVIVAPFSLPILSPNNLEKLAEFEGTEFPLVFRDMLGWENLVASTANAYHSLPVEQKPACAVLANNYGEAAAIDYYGPKYGLPKTICAHNSYWIWGPREYTGEFVLSVGLNPEDLGQGFGEIRKLGEIHFSMATWYESNLSIHLWSKPKLPLKKIWPYIKLYY